MFPLFPQNLQTFPYSTKCINFLHIFVHFTFICLMYVFLSPLYFGSEESCFTRTVLDAPWSTLILYTAAFEHRPKALIVSCMHNPTSAQRSFIHSRRFL